MIMPLNKSNPIDITFKNLHYSVLTPKGPRIILNDIEGICKSGEITAILGPSGAGKTSLLNGLCKRLSVNKNCKFHGKIQANFQDYTGDTLPDFAAYVMQNDILLETLTVKECIQFAADFKVQGSKEAKQNKVMEVIKAFKLERCQNTLIGGYFMKGISGGERKRTSICLELVSDPQVIFLDEPTSGLDSFTAYVLVREIKKFAHSKKRTVILTIHQPSSDIWSMLDQIILMVNGNIIYQGKGDTSILDYFNKNGYQCPQFTNPADYLLSIMDQSKEKNISELQGHISNYQSQIKDKVYQEINNSFQTEIVKRTHTLSVFQQILLILKRTAKVNFRNPILFKSRLIQSVIMALYIGAIWWQITDGRDDPTNFADITNRAGLLYFLALSVFMESLIPCVLTFSVDKEIFIREENSKLYSLFSYFSGKLTIDMATNLFLPVFDSAIAYFMTGLRTDVSAFFIFLAIMIIMSFSGVSIGYIIGTLFDDRHLGAQLTNIFAIPFMLFSGFYKNRGDYASWIAWFEYLSPFKYGFQALCLNEFKETYFTPNPILKYDFEFSLNEAIWMNVVFFGAATLLAFISLKLSKKKLQ